MLKFQDDKRNNETVYVLDILTTPKKKQTKNLKKMGKYRSVIYIFKEMYFKSISIGIKILMVYIHEIKFYNYENTYIKCI